MTGGILPEHQRELEASGISEETRIANGIYSESDSSTIGRKLNWKSCPRKHGSALIYPYRSPAGEINGYCRLKLSNPLPDRKYEAPKGETFRAYFPAGVIPLLKEPAFDLNITEGEKKAIKGTQDGFPTIGLSGVDCFATAGSHGTVLIPDLEFVVWNGRRVFIVFDSDRATKDGVMRAEERLAKLLRSLGAVVHVVALPPGPNEEKVGLDDFLVANEPADLRKLLAEAAEKGDPDSAAPQFRTLSQLDAEFPDLRPSVVEGFLREGETMNVIGATKLGKSWLGYDLALSVATGRPWLDRFATSAGNVLYIDNELHPETSSFRFRTLLEERFLKPSEVPGLLVENLRGRLVDILQMKSYFDALRPGDFKMIVLDATYRFLPAGMAENDNETWTAVYNALDSYAAHTRAAFTLIHHPSKGDQSGKSVTDVGAGGGSQSRAADTHLILRPHEQDDCHVMEARPRSWKPPAPVVLRWGFPVWTVEEGADPEALKRPKPAGDANQEQKDRDGINEIVDVLRKGPATKTSIHNETGIGHPRIARLLSLMRKDGSIKMDCEAKNPVFGLTD